MSHTNIGPRPNSNVPVCDCNADTATVLPFRHGHYRNGIVTARNRHKREIGIVAAVELFADEWPDFVQQIHERFPESYEKRRRSYIFGIALFCISLLVKAQAALNKRNSKETMKPRQIYVRNHPSSQEV